MIQKTRCFHNSVLAILTILATTIPRLSFGQITFFKTFGDTTEGHYDVGYSVLQTEDGGYIVAGEYGRYSVGVPSSYYGDVYLIRTDENGDTLWTKTYGDPEMWEAAYSMDKTDDGGYLISACGKDNRNKLWLIKTNSQGDSLWTRIYPVGKGNCIKRTNDNGFVITGGWINGSSCIYLLKTDPQGETQWLKNCTNYGEGRCVQQTSDNGYVVAGFASGLTCIVKADADGDTVWTKYYFSEYGSNASSICEAKDGGYFIAGQYTEKHGELEEHIWLLRTDSKGDTLWTRKINTGSYGDLAYSCKRTSDGGFIIVGECYYGGLKSDIYLLKLDENGACQWSSTIGGNLGEMGCGGREFRGNDIVETTDGGYIITGVKRNNSDDLFLLKVDNQGQIVEINGTSKVIPTAFELLQNYPNPFNAATIIRFDVAQSSRVTIDVLDLNGRVIKKVSDTYLTPGKYSERLLLQNLSSGIYFYRMQANGFIATRKLILIK